MNKINVLHLVDNWPNKIIPNSGIFLYNTIKQLNVVGEKQKHYVGIILKYNSKDTIRLILKDNRGEKSLLLPYFYKKSFEQSIIKPFFLFYFSVPAKYYKLKLFLIKIYCLKKLIKIINRNNINILHAHISTPAGYLAIEVKKKINISYIIHIHGRDVQQFDDFSNSEKEKIIEVFMNADAIICNSTKTKNLLKKIIQKEGNIWVVPFSVGINSTIKKNGNNIKIKLVSVCNLKKVKSIDDVIMAIKDSKIKDNIEYDIIGYGEEYRRLRDMIIEYKLESVIKLLGSIPNEKVIEMLPKYDAFVLPSVNEAFGVAYLEALANGLPCIAVKGQGWEDIDSNFQAIIPISPHNITELKQAIEFLYFNEKKRKEMGEIAREIVRNNYNTEIINSHYSEIYKYIVKKGDIY